MKYKEWLEDWLELYEKPSVKPRTYKQYSDVVYKRLIPSLGDYDMDELDGRVLQRFIVDLSQKGNKRTGKGLSPNSVSGIVLVLHSSLTMANILGLAKETHIDKIKRPPIKEKPVESFSHDEQKRIEQAVRNDKRDKMFGVLLCLYSGLRIGELLALEWSDIDLTKGEVNSGISRLAQDIRLALCLYIIGIVENFILCNSFRIQVHAARSPNTVTNRPRNGSCATQKPLSRSIRGGGIKGFCAYKSTNTHAG